MSARITVLALGNELMGDDGFGPAVLELLSGEAATGQALPPGVALIEGGVLGPKLMPYFQDSDAVIVIDAVDAGAKPGSLFRFTADEMVLQSAAPVSAHELALPHVLEMTRLLGADPEVVVVACQVEDAARPRIGLSKPVHEALAEAAALVRQEALRLAETTRAPKTRPGAEMER